MKLSILSLALASAGLVANASPMRVVVVNGGAPLELHAINGAGPHPTIHIPAAAAAGRPGCAASRFRQKAGGMVTAIKIAFGFSTPEGKAMALPSTKDGQLPPLPLMPLVPMPLPVRMPPPDFIEVKKPGGDWVRIASDLAGPRAGHHGHIHYHVGERPSFLMRVHFALMSLGPWEGRAVAFVLGCGIGVLLRMAWVLAVLAVRAVRGPRPDALEYTVIDLDLDGGDAEELFVAPPMYTVPVPVPAPAAEAYPAEKAEAEKAEVEAKA